MVVFCASSAGQPAARRGVGLVADAPVRLTQMSSKAG